MTPHSTSPEAARLLDGFIEQMVDDRGLFVLQDRNRAALGQLHSVRHDAENDDLENRLRQALTDQTIAVGDRVRMACAFGAVVGGLLLAGDAFVDVPAEDLGRMVRAVVGDVLPRPAADASISVDKEARRREHEGRVELESPCARNPRERVRTYGLTGACPCALIRPTSPRTSSLRSGRTSSCCSAPPATSRAGS